MRAPFLNYLKSAFLAVPLALSVAGDVTAQGSTRNVEASVEGWSRYLGAEELNALLQADPTVQILDIRSEKYLKNGAIPGAVWVPFQTWRGPKERPGRPPSEEELETLIGQSGLDLNAPIVIHNNADKMIQNGRAAIVYWILKSGGARDLAILRDGYKGWATAELPTAAQPEVLPARTVDLTYNRDWWADPLDIFAVTTGQADGAILDARLDAQVRKSVEQSKPLMSMPMAQFIPASFFTDQLSEGSMTAEAQARFRTDLEARGIDLGTEFLISVCQTGELSALSWFYASEIVGIENVRYYPDALQGWKSDGGLMFGLLAGQ